ncbi:MAG: hypothetical protein AAF358_00080 [Pseudomonadota bacterium]
MVSIRLVIVLIVLSGLGTPRASMAGSKGFVLPPATIRVGSDSECDFSSLGDALDAAADRDLILVNSGTNFLTNGLEIIEKSLTLIGGYPSCTADEPDPDARSTMSGVALNSVLEIQNATATQRTVVVRNFVIRGGRADQTGGGGIDIRENVRVRLDNVWVQENESTTGGGISIRGLGFPASLRLEGGTRVGLASEMFGNTASEEGGGIFCRRAAIEWVDATIEWNAAEEGGGLYAFECQVTTPPITDDGPAQIVGALNNTAASIGGGISLRSIGVGESSIQLSSSPQRQILISGNSAGGDGGGVALSESSFIGDGIAIVDNQSGNSGGGVRVFSSIFDLDRGDGGTCANLQRCSQISGNTAETSAGAVYVLSGTADLRQTFIDNNESDRAPVILATGNDTMVVMRSVQISGNVETGLVNSTLMFGSRAVFDMNFVTVTGNTSDRVIELINNSSLAVSNSIWWEPAMELVAGDESSGTASACMNASDDSSLSADTRDPDFEIIVQNGQPPIYALADTSPNVDACAGVAMKGMGLSLDALGEPRFVDQPDIANGPGFQDRGAFELQLPLLSDGFEDP